MAAMQLTRTHRILIGVVVAGAVVIAAIGFAGSYAAVRELAEQKGFGDFSLVFPIGIDAGICVLLALDLLLTWIRIPFPLLRQTAWLLTAATIAFNGAAAWPDPLGVGMHAVIPVLFVVSVEAARHAVGRIADITADKHMEGVRLTRWLLSPIPTFRLWRRMKLWELRSYEQVIKLEQDRLIYQARLQARYGRAWRRKAPGRGADAAATREIRRSAGGDGPRGAGRRRDRARCCSPLSGTPRRRGRKPPRGRPRQSTSRKRGSGSRWSRNPLRPQPQRQSLSGPVDPQEPAEEGAERFAEAYQAFLAQFQVEPTPTQWAFWLRDTYGISTGSGEPLSEEHVQPLLQALQERYALHSAETAAPSERGAGRPVLVRLLLQCLAHLRAGARRLPRCRGPRGVRIRARLHHRQTGPAHDGRRRGSLRHEL